MASVVFILFLQGSMNTLQKLHKGQSMEFIEKYEKILEKIEKEVQGWW